MATTPGLKQTIWKTILWTFILCFPLAAITAALYRFPIPMGGYESGEGAMARALLAVIFYTLMGGFVMIGALGALAGVVAYKSGKGNKLLTKRISLALSLLDAFVCVLVLANLDKVIGPW